jgi:hypothetical protein
LVVHVIAHLSWGDETVVNLPWPMVSGGILATIVLLGVFFVWRMLKEIRSGFPLRDERTQMVMGRAATYTFYIGSYFMIALMLANILSTEFLGAQLLDGWYAMVLSILVQSLAFSGLHFYFDRKGDFE